MKNNWEIKKIGELCNLATGGTPSRNKPEYFDGGEIKWLVSGDIHKKEIYDCEGRITEEGLNNSNARFLPINSVLIALNGQGKTRGTVALLKTKATCNQSLVSIYPKDTQKILPEYIFCNLHGRYEEIRKITGDDDKDRRGLNMPLIRDIDIPVPPLAEQQRIVAILDEAFAAIAQAKENAEKNLQNVRELFDSYLQSVFANLGDSWEEIKLGNLCEFVRGPFGGSLKKSIFKPEGFAVYEQQHAIYNQFDKIRYFIDDKKFNEMKRFELNSGDLIMSCSGTMGKVAIVPGDIKKGIINQALLKLTPSKKLINTFLKMWMESENFQDALKAYSQGAAIQNIASVKILKDIKMPVPSIDEQQSIINKLDALSAETKKLENIYRQKINDLDELKKSILQKAFSGELTAKRQVSNVIDLPVSIQNITTTDLQAGILATAIQIHHEKGKVLNFGHVKAEKTAHLAQSVLEIELERNPVKDAAGPNDFPRLKSVEFRAEKAGYFISVKQSYGGYSYIPGNRFDYIIEKTKTALGNRAAELTDLIDLLVPLDTQETELVATVYAAWNNLLIDNLTVTDETIVFEARENWHEDKLNIPRERFFNTISWIKQNNLIPNGKGEKSIS